MGKMVILPTTKEPGQEAAFTMEIHGDAAFTLEEISQEHDWIGLYRRGECSAFDQQWRHGEDADGDVVSIAEQNRCFLQVLTLSTPACTLLRSDRPSKTGALPLIHSFVRAFRRIGLKLG